MEIRGISDIALAANESLLGLTGLYLTLLIALGAVRIRVRMPRPPCAGPVARLAPAIGFVLALAGGPASAARRLPIAPPDNAGGASRPWSDASGFPPPRPLARTEATDRSSAHPAIHAQRDDNDLTPLFPRGRRPGPELDRAEAMKRHPAGKGLPSKPAGERDHEDATTRYVVRTGDTLWSIAQRELQTEDLRAVARFWPKIHRANRDSIPDPSLILPGQVLVIPDTKEG